jgi:indolepyruvate ferredoxin oxidoreductase alpha subunit
VHAAAKDDNHKLQIYGKNILPIAGEIRSEFVTAALDVILGKAEKAHTHTKFIPCATAEVCGVKVPPRTSTFCPGCPHRATYWAVKTVTAGKDVVFGGDVGCYVIGMFPPYETQDWLFAMGASGGLTHGIKKVSDQKVIAFYGDSTFFHSGMPPIANAVYNKGNVLFIILDNSATAMTGHQPHPGTGRTGMGDETKKVSIAEVAKALGVDNVATISAWNIKAAIEKIREFLDKPGVSLIVSEGECRLQYMRKVKKLGVKVPMAWIDPAKCKKCGTCVEKFSCPAIHKDGENYYVDTDWCWGCAVCPQICPNKAISMKQYDKPEAKPAEKKKKNNKG